ncbi:hypothetical protein GGQ80_000816 [Sphingomonas jinjuensis]|uniref:Uncharacterized protein n=1 Tax=Sphingomonas jinjuensis TaxID=535907 RepID=A0A840FG06_9SPHN|nr:hypothetical protein [Sphingomonas jinjuensis]MBB4152928.1 hypothetical protein [Sphingomonas jinjuensis]
MSNRSDLNAYRDQFATLDAAVERIAGTVPSPTARHQLNKAVAMIRAADHFVKGALHATGRADVDPLEPLAVERAS